MFILKLREGIQVVSRGCSGPAPGQLRLLLRFVEGEYLNKTELRAFLHYAVLDGHGIRNFCEESLAGFIDSSETRGIFKLEPLFHLAILFVCSSNKVCHHVNSCFRVHIFICLATVNKVSDGFKVFLELDGNLVDLSLARRSSGSSPRSLFSDCLLLVNLNSLIAYLRLLLDSHPVIIEQLN